MNEQEIRTLVRAAIARQTNRTAGEQGAEPLALLSSHASHRTFALPEGADMEGPCIIEPAVTCNHCGYCKSYGH